MAPARRTQLDPQHHLNDILDDDDDNIIDNQDALFIDPMLGTPLSIYIEKDVDDRDAIATLINKHGGTVSPGYSGVVYILVDPYKSSGQNLWRQYAGKKGKVVLNARWVHECVEAGQLHTFHNNWANCKVTGNELPTQASPEMSMVPAVATQPASRKRARQSTSTTVTEVPRQIQPPAQPPPPPPITAIPVDPIVHTQNGFPYAVYGPPMHAAPPPPPPPPRAIHPTTAAPPQTWQAPNSIAPQQTHITPPPPPPSSHPMLHRPPQFREAAWDGYAPQTDNGLGSSTPAGYDYRYREDQNAWVGAPAYFDPSYDHGYENPQPFLEEQPPDSPTAGPSMPPVEPPERPRGRKRTRVQAPPATPAATLVINRNPPARSPTPPTRVIKSTYGGNLFTADDVLYLKRYIDYCQEQGLVLSLREICERIAVKAPHHTFYSWRRYCNKHQIRLGGYLMNPDRSESPLQDGGGGGGGSGDVEMEDEESLVGVSGAPGSSGGGGGVGSGTGNGGNGGGAGGGVGGSTGAGSGGVVGLSGDTGASSSSSSKSKSKSTTSGNRQQVQLQSQPQPPPPSSSSSQQQQQQQAQHHSHHPHHPHHPSDASAAAVATAAGGGGGGTAPLPPGSSGSSGGGGGSGGAMVGVSVVAPPRNRSPTPPRALYRSTTGKGVAFTDQDITFLTKFMDYRKSQGRLDMVAFWKEVATKAPHHSRASWMKYWRRHKHELNRTDTDDPLPQPPDKKMRYSRGDDILLAKYFFDKPEGTSDKIFQAFGRLHPHHPWKGWQEHHRIHKAKIDHFIQQLASGENLDGELHAE